MGRWSTVKAGGSTVKAGVGGKVEYGKGWG